MISRRSFLKKSVALASISTVAILPGQPAKAWVVTAVIAAASLATSLMSRGKKAKAAALVAQANLQILTSIAQEVGAINIGLQRALKELHEIRSLVEKLPQETVALLNHNEMAGLWRRYREKLTAYLDPLNTATTDEEYYSFLKDLYESYALARSKLIEVNPETAYDYSIHVAVAQEYEMMMALELVSDEAKNAGISFDLSNVKVALQESYLPFLRSAIDPNKQHSIPATIKALQGSINGLRAEANKNVVGKFFSSGKSGGLVCNKATEIFHYNDPFKCPDLSDFNCAHVKTVIEHTLTPLSVTKSEEALSGNRSLTSGKMQRGKPYQYGSQVEGIVLNKHKIHEQICDGNINNTQFKQVEGGLFQDWLDIEKEIDARELAIESLVHAEEVCKLAIDNAECRVHLLETGENACGV